MSNKTNKGYQHRECGRCGTEIGLGEKFQDCVEYAICFNCEQEMKEQKHKNDTPDAVRELPDRDEMLRLLKNAPASEVAYNLGWAACYSTYADCYAALRAENDELKRELEKYRQIIPKLPDPNDPDYWEL